jgi:opacity protein-like surface antigen
VGEGAGNRPVSSVNIDMLAEDRLPATRHPEIQPMRQSTLLLLSLFAGTSSLFAQAPEGRFELGVSGGALIYQGDLIPSPAGSYRTLRPMFSVWGTRYLSNKLSVRASLMRGSLHGDDALFQTPEWRKERALQFSTSLTEVSAIAVWDVSGGRSALAPYVFAGVGYTFTSIQRDASHFNRAYFGGDKVTEGLAVDLARTPPRSLAVVPVGLGVRYAVTDNLSVLAETNYRLSRTDYLDGFSEAGNPQLNDHYQSYSIGVTYRFDSFGGGGGRRGNSRSWGCPVLHQ